MEKERHLRITPAAWVAVVLLVVALLGLFIFFPTKNNKSDSADSVGCTLEAKICPDGTAVGRTGKDCQFAECPDEPPVKND